MADETTHSTHVSLRDYNVTSSCQSYHQVSTSVVVSPGYHAAGGRKISRMHVQKKSCLICQEDIEGAALGEDGRLGLGK